MKTKRYLLTAVALSFTCILQAEEPIRPPINPALLYWQAASELPPLTPDQAKELRSVASGEHPVGSVLKIVGDSNLSMALIKKAAEETAPCDWGLPMEEGPGMNLPHISKMQEMSGLAIAKAEILFAEGKVKEGTDWLLTAHRMARHTGAGDLLINYLVQSTIEVNALRAAARHCLGWDEATRHAYATSFGALPPLHSAQAAYGGERFFIDWINRQFTTLANSKPETEALMKSMLGAQIEEKDQKAVAAELEPGAALAAVKDLDSLQKRTQAAVGKPWAEAEPELKAIEDEAKRSTHFLVQVGYPAMSKVAARQYIVATYRTMLEAALAHGAQLDEATAATYHDSLEGDPLRFKKNEDGTLTLQAAHQHPEGKDLALRFGK